MPQQEFEFIDYLGPLAVSICFAVALFLLSLVINFIWITKKDDRTVFEKFGSTFDLRCGVHRMRHRPNKVSLSSFTFMIDRLTNKKDLRDPTRWTNDCALNRGTLSD
uniref:Nematode cuticle collagen N-terminal domain-containing protein n=1 Tax=Ascaris lumbricoides TaxID=6252 RepID=A0A9J2PCL0_ASCLU